MNGSNHELLTVRSLEERIRELEHRLSVANNTIDALRGEPQQSPPVQSQNGSTLPANGLNVPLYHYSQIYNNRHTPMLLIDPETGRIASANPAACEFYGWTLAEITGRSIAEINTMPPDEIRAEMQRAVQSTGSRVFFFRHRLASGELRDVEVHSGPIHESGKEYLFSIVLDISERRRSEARLNMALQASHGGAWELDLKTGQARWSDEMAELFGFDSGQKMEAEGLFALIDARDRDLAYQAIEAAVHGHHDANFVFRVRHPARGERWLEGYARIIYDQNEAADQITGLTFDITERKWIEEALRESEERFRLAVMNAPAIYSQTDENLRYRWIVNPEPGLDTYLEIGKRADELKDSEEIRRLMGLKRRVLETGKCLREELMINHPGGPRWYDMTIEPVRDSANRITGVSTAAFDISQRKRAEEALRLSEERFRLASKATQAVIYDVTMGREELNQSEGLEDLVGYKPGEEPGGSQNWWPENIHSEDAPRIQAELKAAVDGGGDSYAYEYRIRHAKGHWVHVWDQGYILRDDQGKPLRIVGSVSDITERKQAEERLRQSEKRFRDLANAMPQLVWTARPDGTVDYYNERYREFDGFSLVEGETWEWSPVLHPDDRQRSEDAWAKAVREGSTYRVEHRALMADGTYRWHLSRGVPVFDTEGNLTRWYGTGTDIHENKLVEEQLRDRNERLALLSQTANELLAGADPLDLLTQLYERLTGLFGVDNYLYYDLAENGAALEVVSLVGWPEEMLGTMERMKLGQGICGQVARSREVIVVRDVQQDTRPNTAFIRAAGLTAYMCFPLIVDGQLIGTLSFGSRTLTEWETEVQNLLRTVSDLVATAVDRARTEVALQGYADQLERSNRDLQEFAFVASHDLQEPLRKIEAFGAALLETSANLSEKQIDYLGRMRNAAGRMRTMVDDLLALSRVNRLSQPFTPIDLNEIVNEVISDLEMQVTRTGGRIELDELAVIDADPMQIRQLFQNLIGNALKFHRRDVPPVVKIYMGKKKKQSIQLVVEDNGIGFPEAEVERIFQPFQRLVGRSEYDGSGMGLAICRKIVERHQGDITAQSQPGQGSTFILTLPVHQQKTARSIA